MASKGIDRRGLLALTGAVALDGCGVTTKAARIAVGLTCKAGPVDPQLAKNFTLNFRPGDRSWTQGEVGSTSEVFKTHSGKYVVKPGATYLTDSAGKSVGIVQAFDPDTAKEKDYRNDGKATETGRIFEWTVVIITI